MKSSRQPYDPSFREEATGWAQAILIWLALYGAIGVLVMTLVWMGVV
jgi:hypothetical protein